MVFAIIFVLHTGGCRAEPPTLPPTAVPTAELTETAPPAPTAAPTATPTAEPTSKNPPAGASLGDTWTRPIDGMVMVYVPGGQFEMGSDDPFYNNEGPPHDVEVDGFWMDRTEVSNAQYQECVEVGACKPPRQTGSHTRAAYYGESTYADYPVIHVNWYRALAYCNWVGGRLPLEAEWEYAARGPEGRWFPWGNMPDLSQLNYCDANCTLEHADRSSDDGYADTSPVGAYPGGASWVGALDMVGNVWEWVKDWYGYYPSPENPSWLAPDFRFRVIRGGGWDTARDHARCTFRNWREPARAHDSIGFRCAVSVP
ncbi:MAG: formylglycine-generating enzyme family protein [Anaerolineae bacterium]